MSLLILILIILALAMLFGGIFITGLKVLIWIAVALAVIAVILWLVRFIRARGTRPVRR